MSDKYIVDVGLLLDKAKGTGAYFNVKSLISGMRLEEAPIYCKDCAYFDTDGITDELHICAYASESGHDIEVEPDDYCSRAKRKPVIKEVVCLSDDDFVEASIYYGDDPETGKPIYRQHIIVPSEKIKTSTVSVEKLPIVRELRSQLCDKTAYWKRENDKFICSRCGYGVVCSSDYCPGCGSEMRGGN